MFFHELLEPDNTVLVSEKESILPTMNAEDNKAKADIRPGANGVEPETYHIVREKNGNVIEETAFIAADKPVSSDNNNHYH